MKHIHRVKNTHGMKDVWMKNIHGGMKDIYGMKNIREVKDICGIKDICRVKDIP